MIIIIIIIIISHRPPVRAKNSKSKQVTFIIETYLIGFSFLRQSMKFASSIKQSFSLSVPPIVRLILFTACTPETIR
jgi:hypothetical protein